MARSKGERAYKLIKKGETAVYACGGTCNPNNVTYVREIDISVL